MKPKNILIIIGVIILIIIGITLAFKFIPQLQQVVYEGISATAGSGGIAP